MDAGLDKQQIEDLKRWYTTVCADPVRLRLYICLILMAVGYLGVVRPMGVRVVNAHNELKKIKTASRRASAAAHYVGERDFYEHKLTNRHDIVYWQAYVLRKLDAAGVTLNSLDPGEPISKFAFKIVRMQLSARALHYQDILDFVDRIEHGEHVVRIEALTIDEATDALIMTCTILALVKPSLKLKSDTAPKAKGDAEKPPDPEAEEPADPETPVHGEGTPAPTASEGEGEPALADDAPAEGPDG
jgi:hypothetical protein